LFLVEFLYFVVSETHEYVSNMNDVYSMLIVVFSATMVLKLVCTCATPACTTNRILGCQLLKIAAKIQWNVQLRKIAFKFYQKDENKD